MALAIVLLGPWVTLVAFGLASLAVDDGRDD